MSDTSNPYSVVPAPNYAAPIVNLFGNGQQKQGQQGQQGQQNPGQQAGNTLAGALRKLFTPQQGPQGGALAPGSAIPGSAGPTSVGGSTGPTPLMASSANGGGFLNSNGLGLF